MNSFSRLVFAAALTLGLSLATAWEGEVTAVLEGDVIEVTSAAGKVQVRLEGIDCPEHGQEYSKISKRFTSQNALRAVVRVEETGRDGALTIARVRLSRGRDLAEELVRSGMAWWDRVNYPGNSALAELERQARDHYAGLWGDDEPMAPWDYRRDQSAPSIGAGAASPASPEPSLPIIPSSSSEAAPLGIISPEQESSLIPSSSIEQAFAEIPIIKPTRIR